MADAYIDSVVLLLHCDGANGSTAFTDSSRSAKTVTPVSTAQISTAQSKWGGASALFNGTSDYLTVNSTPSDFAFGTGDFTIEFWMYATDVSANRWIYVSQKVGQNPGRLEVYYTSSNRLMVVVGGSTILTLASGVTANAWHHIALTRSGTTNRLFLDGGSMQTATNSDSIVCDSGYPWIGRYSSQYFQGYLDDFRVTKGVARYTSSFTPPAAAFDDPPAPVAHSFTGHSQIAVTPASIFSVSWKHTFSSPLTTINVIPYATKVFTAHNHRITGNVKIDVLPIATLANHTTINKNITGTTTLSVTSASTMQWLTHNHVKAGSTAISVTPSATLVKGQYLGGNAALVIPSLFAYATGWKEEPNAAALVLPSLIGSGVGGAIAHGTLPSLLITATGTQELHGSAEAILPGLYFEGTGQREYNGTATLVIPGFNASSYGAAIAECILPSFTVAGTGTAEFGGKANCILPGLIITATGQREYNGTAALVLPGLRSGDIARAALVIPGLFVSSTGGVGFANSVGYILNVHTNESFEWSNMGFLHIIRIGIDYYGVSSTGLYKLSTAYTTDSGTAINATVTTKSTDFGSYHSKRLQQVYIGSDSSTTLTPIVDGVTKQSHASSFGGRRTRLALGNSGRYWALKVSNITELTGLELLPQELQRRVK
jgi:hypothetical protein